MNLLWVFVVFCLYRDEALGKATSTNAPEKVFYQLDHVDELFKEFIEKYDKHYDSSEYEHRHHVFIKNLIQMNQWNREQPDTIYAIGPFSDLTFEEFRDTYTGLLGNATKDDLIPYEPQGNAPDSLDWRQRNVVTEVKSQGHCGSCYIFSAIGNIESQWAKKTNQLISLSEQQGLDCKNTNGCQGGRMEVVMQALAQMGVVKESDYPYQGRQGQCHYDKSKVVVRLSGGSVLNIPSEEALKDAVANIGPLSIGIGVTTDFQSYRSGVFVPRSKAYIGRHAVLLVGYGSDGGTPYWIIKNSWGTGWGESGYMRMVMGRRACDIGLDVVSSTVL